MKGKVFLVVFVVLCFLASGLESQTPRGTVKGKRFETPYSTPRLQEYLTQGSFFHQVTVDSGGSGDYSTISAALAFVASQAPTLQNQWTVLVYPGSTDPSGYSYSEQSITAPPYTNVEGVTAAGTLIGQVNGRAMIRITGTSGIGVTLSAGSSLTNLGFHFTGALQAGYVGFQAGLTSAITRCVIAFGSGAANVQADIIKVAAPASIYVEGSYIQRLQSNMSNTRHLYVPSGIGIVSSSWLLASSGQAAVIESAGGSVRVFHSRIYGGAVTDLRNTSGLLSADGVAYSTESGNVTRAGTLTPRIASGGSTLPANCTVPEVFVDTTGGAARLCVCSATNTWKCANLS